MSLAYTFSSRTWERSDSSSCISCCRRQL
jgi:hypothetical protein